MGVALEANLKRSGGRPVVTTSFQPDTARKRPGPHFLSTLMLAPAALAFLSVMLAQVTTKEVNHCGGHTRPSPCAADHHGSRPSLI